MAIRCVKTMMNEWDAYQVDETTAGRTIFVDNAGLTATDFHLTQEQQDTLFRNGVAGATNFIIEMARLGHVPRSAGADLGGIRRTWVTTPAGIPVAEQDQPVGD